MVVDPADEPEPDVASIGSANWAGGFAAAEHLIELGHRRIGMISGPEDMLCSIARVDGYRSALERAGIGFDAALVRAGDFHVAGGHSAATELLAPATSRRPRSSPAATCRRSASTRPRGRAGSGSRDDLSVVGYDDLRIAPLGRAAADDDPPAADRDGRDRRPSPDPDDRGPRGAGQPALRPGDEPDRARVDGAAAGAGAGRGRCTPRPGSRNRSTRRAKPWRARREDGHGPREDGSCTLVVDPARGAVLCPGSGSASPMRLEGIA